MARKPTGPGAKYTVVRSPIDHNGETYQPGEPIELTETEATPLLAVNAVEQAGADKAEPKKD